MKDGHGQPGVGLRIIWNCLDSLILFCGIWGFGLLCLFELMLLRLLMMMLRGQSSHNMTGLLLPHAGLPYVDAVEERFGGLSKFRGTIGLIVFGGLS